MNIRLTILCLLLAVLSDGSAISIHSRKLNTSNGLPDNNVRNIGQDGKGFMWLGTPNGLYRFDGYFYTSYKADASGHSLNNNHIGGTYALQQDLMLVREQNNILSLYDVRNNRFVALSEADGEPLHFRYHAEIGGTLWLWDKDNGCGSIRRSGDGVSYRHYHTRDGSLESDHVQLVAADAKGAVWILTDEEAYCLQNGRPIKVAGGQQVVSVVNIGKSSYFVTRHGDVLIAEGQRLRVVYHIAAPRQSATVLAAAEYRDGHILLVTTGMTLDYDTHTNVMTPSSIQAPQGGILHDNLGNAVVTDMTGKAWFVDHTTFEVIEMQVFDPFMARIVASWKYKVLTAPEKGLVWFSTNGYGLTVYDRKTHSVQRVRQESGLISTNYIQDICLDREENIWAADEFHGVDYLTVEDQDIQTLLMEETQGDLYGNQVKNICLLRDSTLLITNARGDFYLSDNQLQQAPRLWRQGVAARTVGVDHEGTLWIGMRKRGLQIGEATYTHSDSDTTTISSDRIWHLFCDRQGRMWVSTEDAQLDLAVPQQDGTYTFRHIMPAAVGAKIVAQDHRHTIWVGAKSGLYAVVRQADRQPDAPPYRQVLSEKDLQQSEVSCIFEDTRQRLWIGTIGSGLFYADNSGDGPLHFLPFTTANGLMSNEVQDVTEDDGGTLWIATKKGITCYHPEKQTFRYLYNDYNLLQNYYSELTARKLPDGRMAFGTMEGIVVYNPQASHRQDDHRLTITDILVNGISVGVPGAEHVIGTSPDNVEKITLAHDQNAITIRFSNFNYATMVGTRYTYYLEHYDKEWSELSTESQASYKKLAPGSYVLHIKAYDNNTSENVERLLTIVVRHPWWATWWAYLIYILLLGAIGYAVYRQLSTIYHLRRRISIEKELTEYKLMFFTNISHEFRTPLTIIRGAMDHIRATKDVPGQLKQPLSSMGKSVDRMLRLINQLLEFRKMQSGKLRLALEETDVVAFLRSIFESFMELADNKHISYTFLPKCKSYVMYIDRAHVDKIFYNLLSNAFKYTPSKGSVSVRVDFDDDRQLMTLRVADSGVGIPKEKQAELFQRFMQSSFSNKSTGIGLHLTHELVNVHHGSIRYEENQPRGSVFIVELPTDKGVYQEQDFLRHSELQTEPATAAQQLTTYREVAGEPLNDRRVLVVEDDADVITYLGDLLGRYFVVEKAMDGAEALETIRRSRPDLVISDVSMPVMDGFELTARIRGDKDLQDLPVILLTAFSGEQQRLKGETCGADAYVTKPFDNRLLVATCRKLMEQRAKLRTAYAQEEATGKPVLPEIIIEERDKQFLDLFNARLQANFSNPNLSVDSMAEEMGYSRTAFFKKVKALTGQTPADYIRTLRLNYAAELLREDNVTVAEVSYKVGIGEPHYFTKMFKAQFGISPKKYQMGKK